MATRQLAEPPICDRCHNLVHHHQGIPIPHPSLNTIKHIISQSPHLNNCVYHVIDAADFPLSLIPQLHDGLSLAPQRSKNRRAKAAIHSQNRRAELNFVITRSDLLAPQKEQVDGMMNYLVQVIRDSLGLFGRGVRLGNVRCVSAKRGWWIRQLKDEIYQRGGGGWLVGKANVGKSNLLEVIYPRNRNANPTLDNPRRMALRPIDSRQKRGTDHILVLSAPKISDPHHQARPDFPLSCGDDTSHRMLLLPPPPVETPFPVMPVVSFLAGTTASPIRLPFGRGKGELVDLPGLTRDDLMDCVQGKPVFSPLMQQRVKAKKYIIKPGQSILIGGLVRITPTYPDAVVLAHAFVPLECHVTSTQVAIGIQDQRVASRTSKDVVGIEKKIRLAGVFEMKWDITKAQAGHLTAKEAVGQSLKTIPFIVFSTDILIESYGWIELATQLRRDFHDTIKNKGLAADKAMSFPSVKVFSPEGKYVGARRPMCSWMFMKKTSAKKRNVKNPRFSFKIKNQK